MPSVSEKQAKFMRAVAHNPKFARKVGVPQKVGKEFAAADKREGRYQFGGMVSPALVRGAIQRDPRIMGQAPPPQQQLTDDQYRAYHALSQIPIPRSRETGEPGSFFGKIFQNIRRQAEERMAAGQPSAYPTGGLTPFRGAVGAPDKTIRFRRPESPQADAAREEMQVGRNVSPSLQGYLQRLRQMNQSRVERARNRIGQRDQQGALARALQRGTGRPPMSRRYGFPGGR